MYLSIYLGEPGDCGKMGAGIFYIIAYLVLRLVKFIFSSDLMPLPAFRDQQFVFVRFFCLLIYMYNLHILCIKATSYSKSNL